MWRTAGGLLWSITIGVLFIFMILAALWFNGALSDQGEYCPDHEEAEMTMEDYRR